MSTHLTESSRAVVLLRKTFAANEVLPGDSPKHTWESDPIFREHKLNAFRTKFNKLKAEYIGGMVFHLQTFVIFY